MSYRTVTFLSDCLHMAMYIGCSSCFIHTNTHTHKHIHTCAHTYTYTHTLTHTHKHTCIHTHKHTCTRTYTHTHTHTIMHAQGRERGARRRERERHVISKPCKLISKYSHTSACGRTRAIASATSMHSRAYICTRESDSVKVEIGRQRTSTTCK